MSYYKNFKDLDDDEEEYVYSPRVEALRSLLSKVSITENKFNDILHYFDSKKNSILPKEDLKFLGNSIKNEGVHIAVDHLIDFLIPEKDGFDNLHDSFVNNELDELAEQMQHALSIKEKELEEYEAKYKEYIDTKDESLLASIAPLSGANKKTIDPKEFIPRNYQKELAEIAVTGKNCLICAPTNSGKTYTAMLIVNHHITKLKEKSTSRPCAIFLVPRYALLQQIYEQFKRHLYKYSIAKKSGQSPNRIELNGLLKQNDIVIMTLDILKNSLDSGVLRFTDFSLLIFDECHHATKDHSYKKIMLKYLQAKESLDATLPQVVGFTASPGAGPSVSIVKAKEWIFQLCSNLDAYYFVTVRNNIDELRKFTQLPNRLTRLSKSRDENPFDCEVKQHMLSIEDQFFIRSSQSHGSQEYASYITTINSQSNESKDDDMSLVCDHLIEMNNALILAEQILMKDGLELLEKYSEKLQRRNEKLLPIERMLKDKLSVVIENLHNLGKVDEQYPNPKLLDVKNILLKSKKECDDDPMKEMEFRAMIYVKSRLATLALCNWIKNDKDLCSLNPGYLTGVHASSESGGLSADETRFILREFAKGVVKVIVSTTAGEEGIDIPACRLIIRLDHVTSEISMIQARGRIRAKTGDEVIIGSEQVLSKDATNVLLEEVMEKAINEIIQLTPEDFRRFIEDCQAKSKQEVIERKRQESIKINEDSDADAKLLCRNCKVFACDLKDILSIHGTNYVNTCAAFMSEKVTCREHHKEKMRRCGIHKIYCSSCDLDWGNTCNGFPCLKISSFLLESNGRRREVSKWKSVKYTVAPFV